MAEKETKVVYLRDLLAAYEKEQIENADSLLESLHARGYHNGLTMAKAIALKLAAADVIPVVYGQWEFINDYESRCSHCKENFWIDHEHEYRYCPNCGAMMKEKW